MLKQCIQHDFFFLRFFGEICTKYCKKIGYFGQFFRTRVDEGCWNIKIHLFGPVHSPMPHVPRCKCTIFWRDMDETLLKNGTSGQIPSIISGGGVFLPALGIWFPQARGMKKCFEFFWLGTPSSVSSSSSFFHMQFFREISSKLSEKLVV